MKILFFIQSLDEGQTIYMYWDVVDEEWKFAGQKKLISPYIETVKKIIKKYNVRRILLYICS